MKVHVFVLHLVRAPARRENAQTLLSDAREIDGVTAEIWSAVDGGAMSSSDLAASVGAELFQPGYPFSLNANEIGCMLSHRQIWAEMQMRETDAALVIEDDAEVDPDTFRAAISLARAHIQRLGYIQFQTSAPQGASHLVDTSGDCRLVVPMQPGLRTPCQMVSRAAAAHLLALSDPFDRPVDAFVKSHWHTGLRPAAIYPSGVFDISEELGGSTMRSDEIPWIKKLACGFHRLRYRASVSHLSRKSSAPDRGGFAWDEPDAD